MRRALLVLALLGLVGCEKTVVGDPQDRPLTLRVKLAELDALDGVGSFDLVLRRDGEVALETALNFDAAERLVELAPGAEAPILEAAGEYQASLRARDIAGNPLDIGGDSEPVSVALAEGGAIPVLVGAFDAFAPIDLELSAARFGHAAALLGGARVAAIGGYAGGDLDTPGALAPAVELLDPFGASCTTDGADDGCGLGAAPPRRARHALVDTSVFDAGCPLRGGVAFFGGEGADGAALGDLWYLGDEGLVALAELSPRADAAIVALRTCKLLVIGGLSDPADPGSAVATVDVVELTGADGAVDVDALSLPAPVSGAAAVAGRNGIDEVLVLGGLDDTGAPTDAASLITQRGAQVCDLADTACNGGEGARLSCARGAPVAAAIPTGDLARFVVLGDDAAETCASAGAAAELISEDTGPYYSSAGAGAGGGSVDGHALVALKGSALRVGGRDAAGDALDLVERVSAAGAFSAAAPLTAARAGHAVARRAGVVVVVGGHDGAGPRADVELYLEAP